MCKSHRLRWKAFVRRGELGQVVHQWALHVIAFYLILLLQGVNVLEKLVLVEDGSSASVFLVIGVKEIIFLLV